MAWGTSTSRSYNDFSRSWASPRCWCALSKRFLRNPGMSKGLLSDGIRCWGGSTTHRAGLSGTPAFSQIW